MNTQIANYIRAGYPGIFIVSSEEPRVEAEVRAVADSLQYSLYAWSITDGLVDTSNASVRGAQDPMEAMSLVEELPESSIVLMRDLHMFLEDPNPLLVRAVKNALRAGKTMGKGLIVVACRLALPPELERDFVSVEFSLPDKEMLGVVLDNIATCAGKPAPEGEDREQLLESACGLTSTEAENAFALSVVEMSELSPAVVAREKALEVKKNGLLEIVPVPAALADVGGLDLLKAWLLQRRDAFSGRAAEYGLPTPKGLMIIGIPGTGKSLTAKATASVFERPLLKLDAGRIYGGLVGQSEANLRSVIRTAEAIAPCALWIDEIEKAFSGTASSGNSDGGTSSRVFGTFLSWMQDRISPVFIVATANDVSQLPPELLRKGRFDEIFHVDLPTSGEREAIWRIQIAKYGRDPAQFDVPRLSAASDGLTGSEIEQAFIDALYGAFSSGQEPTIADIDAALQDLVPLSRLMGEKVDALRKWAQGRTRPATTPEPDRARRKIQY